MTIWILIFCIGFVLGFLRGWQARNEDLREQSDERRRKLESRLRFDAVHMAPPHFAVGLTEEEVRKAMEDLRK